MHGQDAGGRWTDDAFTTTAIPRRAYVRSELSALHFPLRALGQYRARAESVA